MAEAEEHTGIYQQQVARWRQMLEDTEYQPYRPGTAPGALLWPASALPAGSVG